MRRLIQILIILVVIAGLLGLLGLVLLDTEESVRVDVSEAVVTLPAVPGVPGAAYFTLRGVDGGTALVSVSSPRAERIELHESRNQGGISRMVPIGSVSVTDHVRFEPGGKHAMVFGIDSRLRPGDRVSLTFQFSSAPPVTVDAEVRGPGRGHAEH